MKRFVSLNGKYPRSEALIRATRDHDRGRISREELERAYDSDYDRVKGIQEGFPMVSDGLLNWQDIVRPFASLVKDAHVGGLVRYFETNTFYRKIFFQDTTLRSDIENWASRYFRFGNLAILPSPYTLHRFSEGISIKKAGELIGAVVEYLRENGYDYFFLQEPALVYYRDVAAMEELRKALEFISGKAGEAMISLNTYFADASPLIRDLLSMPVSAIGIDFTFTDVESLMEAGWDRSKGMVAGILDTQNSLMETEGVLRPVMEKIEEGLRPMFLIYTGSSDFEFLPASIADKKVEILRKLGGLR